MGGKTDLPAVPPPPAPPNASTAAGALQPNARQPKGFQSTVLTAGSAGMSDNNLGKKTLLGS